MRWPLGRRNMLGVCHPGTAMAMQRIAVRGQSLGALRYVVDGIHGSRRGSRGPAPQLGSFVSSPDAFRIQGLPEGDQQDCRREMLGATGSDATEAEGWIEVVILSLAM